MLFGRQVALQFGTETTPGRSFTDLTVGFRVELARAGRPGTARIEVKNLDRTSIAQLQTPRAIVQLLAGYDVPRMIFRGNPVKNGVTTRQQGATSITTIDAHDGGRAYQDATVNVSFSTETSLAQVFEVVAAQLGLPRGTIRLPPGGDVLRFPHGCVLSGKASTVLDRLARAAAADWFVRDGVLQFVGQGTDTGETAVVFSSANGNLIGSPSPKTPTAASTPSATAPRPGTIEITGLLDPSMRPGRLFVVESPTLTGTYIARDVTFVGDSGFETAFYAVITGEPRSPA